MNTPSCKYTFYLTVHFDPSLIHFASHSDDAAETTRAKLKSFARLPAGWRYGEGAPISPAIIQRADGINREAIGLGFASTDAFPAADGAVLLTVYHGPEYLEFIIEPDDTVSFFRERDKQEIDAREGLTIDAALLLLKEIWKEICDSSDSSIHRTTMQGRMTSRAQPSGSPVQEGYPLSSASA